MRQWLQRHRRLLLIALGVTLGIFVVAQLLYPGDRMAPFSQVEGLSVGGWLKKDAEWELDARSAKQPISIYFGKASKPHKTPKPSDIGLKVSHENQIADMSYPWYMRLIPTSILWQNLVQRPSAPTYARKQATLDAYIKASLGDSCDIKPKDASLVPKQDKLVVVPSADGGVCKQSDVNNALLAIKPVITKDSKIVISVDVVKPAITNDVASKLATNLNERIGSQVNMKVNGKDQAVPASEVLKWMVFAPKDAELTMTVSKDLAGAYFAKEVTPKVTVAAGVTKITTQDFAEIARVNGANGQTLDVDQTLASLSDFLTGKQNDVTAVPVAIGPRIEYVRSYTSTSNGIAALIAHYAQDHAGTFGVSFTELTGAGRSAVYNSGKSFTTASTYKLFVAYGTLKKAESGEWKWSDQISGGRDMAACFDDMIVKSDNACAEALLSRYGRSELTNAIHDLGLGSSGFGAGSPYTTSSDLGLFLTKLESSQLGISADSRSKLIGAMKRNIYAQGIPAGAKGEVADKVGFLNALLHDAAIVYSPTGTYVLVIMTDGSSWANIAELTRQIEALRTQ